MGKMDNIVVPGQGLRIEEVDLADPKEAMRQGTYDYSPYRPRLEEVHANLSAMSDAEIIQFVQDGPQKVGKNAYVSLLMEESGIYYQYSSLVTGDDQGIYSVEFNDRRSTLHKKPLSSIDALSAWETVLAVADSNQSVLAHLVCTQFVDGKIPAVSPGGGREKDEEYFKDYEKIADIIVYLGRLIRYIPENMDGPSVAITSGSFALKALIFELPNLITAVTRREGIRLTPEQQRTSFLASAQTSMVHQYLPTLPVATANLRPIADRDSRHLRPEAFTHNGNLDRLVVYPIPELIEKTNAKFAGNEQDLPAQTNCPVYHSKVTTASSPDKAYRFPAMVVRDTLTQYDELYFRKYAQEYAAGL